MSFTKIIILIIIIFVFWVGFTSLYVFYLYTHPDKLPNINDPEDEGMRYEDISFRSTDDIILAGWFIPASPSSQGGPAEKETKKTVIVLHGYPANKADVLSWGKFLHHDYNLLFFDFRAHGQSQGNYTTVGPKEIMDLEGAIQYLKKRQDVDASEIGVMGFSLGGAVAIMTAENSPEIKAIVTDSTYASLDLMLKEVYKNYWRLGNIFSYFTKFWAKKIYKIDISEHSPEKSIETLSIPLLIIHAENDEVIPAENSRLLYEAAGGPKELWIIPEASHGEAYSLEKEKYEAKVKQFFEKYLP